MDALLLLLLPVDVECSRDPPMSDEGMAEGGRSGASREGGPEYGGPLGEGSAEGAAEEKVDDEGVFCSRDSVSEDPSMDSSGVDVTEDWDSLKLLKMLFNGDGFRGGNAEYVGVVVPLDEGLLRREPPCAPGR
jgi:hypothetical protein